MKNFIFVAALLVASFWHWGVNFVITIFAISFLIFFHELGHYLAARFFGVTVDTFSIGFGGKIYTKKINQTTYCISAIPLGGYVALRGQNEISNKSINEKGSWGSISAMGRICILFAGPFFNLLLAFFIYISLGLMGVEKLSPKVGAVLKDSAALEANLRPNDEIIAINGVKIQIWDDIKKQVKPEQTLLNIKRGNDEISITLTPKIASTKNMFGEEIKTPLIGITPSGELKTVYYSGLSGINYAFDETINASKLIYKGLEKLIIGDVPIKDMGGIVAMADITTKASHISLSALLIIVALISVNLGILNLLPLPVLDGGHIVFNLYEIIFRRKINENIFTALSYGSMALLFALMAFTIVNDILRISGIY